MLMRPLSREGKYIYPYFNQVKLVNAIPATSKHVLRS